MTAELVAAGAAGVIASEAVSRVKGSEPNRVLDELCAIHSELTAIRAYSEQERRRMPSVIPMQSTYAAGVPGVGSTVFNPQAPFNIDYIEILSTVAGTISLLFGTRSEPIAFAAGGRKLETPYNVHSQISFGPDPGGAFANTVYLRLVGAYERQGTLDKGTSAD